MRTFVIALSLWIVFSPDRHGAGADSKPIDIAAIFALTGQAANANRSSLLGTRIAVDEINGAGGLLGRKINLVVLDNMSTPIGSDLAASQAAAAHVSAIIGADWSSHSLAVARVAQMNKIPMISTFSTNTRLTRTGDFIHRVCFTDHFQGRIMAEFARNGLHAKTALVFVNITSDYSLELSEIFKKIFEEMGGRVLAEIEYKFGQQTYDSQMRKASTVPADVLFLPGHDENGTMLEFIRAAGIQGIPLGGDGWGVQSFFEGGGDRLPHGYYCTHWSESNENPKSRRFVSEYRGKNDFDVGAALGYDAVMLLSEAVKRSGDDNPLKIKESLEKITTFEGVTGAMRFDENRDPVKCAIINEIRDGKPYYFKTFCPE